MPASFGCAPRRMSSTIEIRRQAVQVRFAAAGRAGGAYALAHVEARRRESASRRRGPESSTRVRSSSSRRKIAVRVDADAVDRAPHMVLVDRALRDPSRRRPRSRSRPARGGIDAGRARVDAPLPFLPQRRATASSAGRRERRTRGAREVPARRRRRSGGEVVVSHHALRRPRAAGTTPSIAATPPARRRGPCMQHASSSTTPSAFGSAPTPTLVSSGSSSTIVTPSTSASSTSTPVRHQPEGALDARLCAAVPELMAVGRCDDNWRHERSNQGRQD